MTRDILVGTEGLRTVNAFYSALGQQAVVVLLVVGLALVSWRLLPSARHRSSGAGERGSQRVRTSILVTPEPAARRLLRISFGLLWVLMGSSRPNRQCRST
jgi:hypothetical protein